MVTKKIVPKIKNISALIQPTKSYIILEKARLLKFLLYLTPKGKTYTLASFTMAMPNGKNTTVTQSNSPKNTLINAIQKPININHKKFPINFNIIIIPL